MFKVILGIASLAGVSVLMSNAAHAQSFPAKPVRIVIGSSPGG